MGLFNNKPNFLQSRFINAVISGKKKDIKEIFIFLEYNGKLELDEETSKAFKNAIENLTRDKNTVNKPRYITVNGFRKTENEYEREFIVVGVGYDNRQDIIKDIKKRMPLTINITKFKGQPAIEVLYNEQKIGYIAKEDIEDIVDSKDHIKHIEVDRTYTNSNGEKGLYAKITLSDEIENQ